MSIQSDELEKFHPSHCNKYEILRGVYPNDKRLTGKPCSCGFEKVTLAWREQYCIQEMKYLKKSFTNSADKNYTGQQVHQVIGRRYDESK